MDYIQRDRSLMEHAESDLKDYLLSDQLFWPLNSGERLTLGSLLLALQRLQALAKTPEDIQRFTGANELVFNIRGKWRTNWANKASLEFHSRLRQWELALRELLSKEQRSTVIYTHEVTLRVILSLLQSEILQSDVPAYEHLGILDRQLLASTHKTDFIWDPALRDQFPMDRYWFLYRQPATGEKS